MITEGAISADVWLAALAEAPITNQWYPRCQTRKPIDEFYQSLRRRGNACKKCLDARHREYFAQNRERINAQNCERRRKKRSLAANLELTRARDRARYLKERERRLAYQREYRARKRQGLAA